MTLNLSPSESAGSRYMDRFVGGWLFVVTYFARVSVRG